MTLLAENVNFRDNRSSKGGYTGMLWVLISSSLQLLLLQVHSLSHLVIFFERKASCHFSLLSTHSEDFCIVSTVSLTCYISLEYWCSGLHLFNMHLCWQFVGGVFLVSAVLAQFPAKPKGLTTLVSKLQPVVTIDYKQV